MFVRGVARFVIAIDVCVLQPSFFPEMGLYGLEVFCNVLFIVGMGTLHAKPRHTSLKAARLISATKTQRRNPEIRESVAIAGIFHCRVPFAPIDDRFSVPPNRLP